MVLLKKSLGVIFLASILLFLNGCGSDDQTQNKETFAANEIIDMHGQTENLERLDTFVNNVQSGVEDEVELVRYTTEGAPILHNLKYSGSTLTFTLDTTKDAYGNGGVTSYDCNSIRKEESNIETKYVLEGCPNSQINELLYISHDVEKEDYFAFQLNYGVGQRNEINTKEEKLSIYLEDGQTVTVSDFQFSKEEMNNIYRRMILGSYLKQKILSNSCKQEPHESYELKVWINSATKHYEWDECDQNKDGQEMTELVREIVKILEGNSSYPAAA